MQSIWGMFKKADVSLQALCWLGVMMPFISGGTAQEIGLLVAGPLTTVIVLLLIVWDDDRPHLGRRLALLVGLSLVAAFAYFFSSAGFLGSPLMLMLVCGLFLEAYEQRKKAAG